MMVQGRLISHGREVKGENEFLHRPLNQKDFSGQILAITKNWEALRS